MEIPDELRNFLDLDKAEERLDVAGMMVGPDKKGGLINFANLIEEEMDAFLHRRAQQGDGVAQVRTQARFADKIKATETVLISIDPQNSEHSTHIEFAETIRRLRNIAAHNTGIGIQEAQDLADDPAVVALAKEFPQSGWTAIGALRDHLSKY